MRYLYYFNNTCFVTMTTNSLLPSNDRIRINNCPPSSPINSTNSLSTIDVHLLPLSINSSASAIVDRVKEGGCYIREVVLKVRRNRKYILVNRNTEKEGSQNINMEDVHISAPTIRRLLTEALHLIEQLHRSGLKLNFPLKQLLQLESIGLINFRS